jgi:AcrR family transcriptional regulator
VSALRHRLSEEERRAQILRATIAVVARDGFEGASTNRIAEQAGVSKGLIWHYFADKTDLLKQALMSAVGLADAVLRQPPGSLGEELSRQADPPAGRVPDRLRNHIRSLASWARAHWDEYRAMDEIVRKLRGPDGELVFTLRDYEPVYQAYEDGYRRAQAAGIFRDFDTRVMAMTYQSAIDSMLAYCYSHPDVDIEEYADRLADILLAAMTRRD